MPLSTRTILSPQVELAADERSLSIGVQCVAASAFNVTSVAHSSLLRGAARLIDEHAVLS